MGKPLNYAVQHRKPNSVFKAMEAFHRERKKSYPIDTYKENLIDAYQQNNPYIFKETLIKMKFDPELLPKDHYEVNDYVLKYTNDLNPDNVKQLSPFNLLKNHTRYIRNTRDK